VIASLLIFVMLRMLVILATWTLTAALVSRSSQSPFEVIKASKVLNHLTGSSSSPLEGVSGQKSLVVLLPQLGEFDSAEMCEQLLAVEDQLAEAGVSLRVVGIGSSDAAEEFCGFTGISPNTLRVDPDATLHRALGLHAGPGWTVPEYVSDGMCSFLLSTLPGGAPEDESLLRTTADAWLNYLAMCAGLGAPGTLREILRGYFGDQSAPERFAPDDEVTAGFVKIGPGVGPVKLGPFTYSNWWADESGYQRPVELATVRLKNMVEVLSKWDRYVSNPLTIAQRGATYVFDEAGEVLYEYRHRGVLTYSETMPRPLSFLEPYIGENAARNPLGLGDTGGGGKRGRGILKPAGKAMGLLGPVFSLENRLQAQLLGADDTDLAAARKEIEDFISKNGVVVFTYGLSPFSGEALALLDAAGADYEKVELGLEWFLLGKKESAMRAELLAMTGQSSLPHVFIAGKHVGGLFSGPPEGGPGIAALQEAGELEGLLQTVAVKV
jgi:glutaredoxin-related protein